MSDRKKVIAGLVSVIEAHRASCDYCRGDRTCSVIRYARALRAIIEAHECRTKMRMQPGGGEGEIHPCNPKTCPVAIAAHELRVTS